MLVVVDDIGKPENLTSLQLLIEKVVKYATSKSKVLMNCQNWQILKFDVSEYGKNGHEIFGGRASKDTIYVLCIR
jgi:hypothetical protein